MGAGFGLTIVAAGLSSTWAASSSPIGTFLRERATGSAATPPSAGAALARTGRLGLGSSGSSRPLPSLTLRLLASVVSSGVIARTPFCPISSAARMRSLLVTPNSFASSMTLIFAAATIPSPPRRRQVVFHCGHQRRLRPRRTSERLTQSSALDQARGAAGTATHVRAAAGSVAALIDDHRAFLPAHEPHQLALATH